jgi:hypothetical protein
MSMKLCCASGWQIPVGCATGHRPWAMSPGSRRWTRDKLDAAVLHLRDFHGMRVGLSGMAQGTDLWWADSVVRAGLILGAHVPCKTQTKKWTSGVRREWQRLRDLAVDEWSHEYADEYTDDCMEDRNRGMVAASAGVVSVYEPGRTGGTFRAVRYAIDIGRVGYHLDPVAMTVKVGLPSLT